MNRRFIITGCIIFLITLTASGTVAGAPEDPAHTDISIDNITISYGDSTNINDISSYGDGYVAVGTWIKDDNSTGFVQLIDNTGERVFTRNFSTQSDTTRMNSVTVNENKVTAIGETRENGSISPLIVEVNETGTVLSETTITRFEGDTFTTDHAIHNDTYVVVGAKEETFRRGFAFKSTAEGDVEWSYVNQGGSYEQFRAIDIDGDFGVAVGFTTAEDSIRQIWQGLNMSTGESVINQNPLVAWSGVRTDVPNGDLFDVYVTGDEVVAVGAVRAPYNSTKDKIVNGNASIIHLNRSTGALEENRSYSSNSVAQTLTPTETGYIVGSYVANGSVNGQQIYRGQVRAFDTVGNVRDEATIGTTNPDAYAQPTSGDTIRTILPVDDGSYLLAGERATLRENINGNMTPIQVGGITTFTPTDRYTVPSIGQPSLSIDSDRTLEDVNGDGRGGLFDALAYYNNRNDPVIRENPDQFDFDGDGEAGTLFDALALYNEVSD